MDSTVIQRLGAAWRTQVAERRYGIDALCRQLEQYLPAQQVAVVRRAYALGARLHAGQVRSSGEPYIYHPLAVARILADMRMDHQTVAAAILHDAIEDTEITKAELAAEFGDDVAELVDGVSKLDRAEGISRAEAQAENLRKLLLAVTQDLRVILIKLADRLHNMRTLHAMPAEKRRRIARETLDIYAPIAHRLGIHFIRVELEDLAFMHLYPRRHAVLSAAVQEQLGDSRRLIREIEQRLSRALKEEGIGATVVGRQKNLYSIYTKMRRKRLSFLDVMDLLGFRIIVSTVDECYRALGIVHHVYQPISELFNDFIAAPKVNGYQSLHTTCVGPQGRKIEIQIRTRDMHHIAESGIAAHWQYKLGTRPGGAAPQVRAREWLNSLFDLHGGGTDFVETLKVDLFPDEVYVFTPKGQIRRLPRGATPVDFAYAVHTDLGDHCVAARVDQRLEPLSMPLKNGQTVEIITSRSARPNAAWLNFVKTAKARSRIRHYLKSLREDEAVRLGRRLLEKAMRELDIPLSALRGDSLERVLRLYQVDDIEQLLLSIGLGQRLAPLVARQFAAPGTEPGEAAETMPLSVKGTEGLVVDYARCCHPIPGDEIRGHVSSGRGIVIHRLDCTHAQAMRGGPQDWVAVVWDPAVQGDFLAEIRVTGQNRRGVLARIATEISNAESSIENVQMADKVDTETADMRFLITVRDRRHLARILRRLRRLEGISRVSRV